MFKGTYAGSDIDDYGSLGSGVHYATDIDVGSGELWSPFKSLFNILNTTIEFPTIDNINIFQDEISKCKSHFQSKQLLTSRPRNPTDREELRKSTTEAIYLLGHEDGKSLPAQLVNEAILMSDLFEINEFHALDLLVTGEAEMESYPCWPRGLVAVYIYFEGQYSLVGALRAMLKICPGNTWGSTVHSKIIETCNSILDQTLVEDFMDKVLNLLDKFDIKKQMEALDTNLGLGDWRHRTGVLSFLKGVRETLAEIIFYWSAQRGLAWPDTLRILEYLKTHVSLSGDRGIRKEDVSLVSAVLYAVDFNLSTHTFNQKFAMELRKYYMDSMLSSSFVCCEILDVIRLSYHVAIHKHVAETSLNSIHGGTSTVSGVSALLRDEELDFKTDVFKFLKSEFFYDKDTFSNEENIMRLYHQLFCDFLLFMPIKLKDMKTKSEEAWRLAEMYHEQGLNRPSELSFEFENFLETLGVFYSADTGLELAKDYFRDEPSYGSLHKLVRNSCVDTAAMFLPNVKMLSGLATSFPPGVFELLKQPGHNLSLDHFYDSITKYLQTVGSQLLGDVTLPTVHTNIYQSDMFQRVVMNPSRLRPTEITSICAYLDLLKNICATKYIQEFFTATKKQWFQLTLISAKERGFPREIRLQLLDAASCMVLQEPTSTEYIMAVWEIFYSTRLIEYGTSDLKEELEERETRLESYSLTINFLKLIDALVYARFSSEDHSSRYDVSDGATIDGTLLEPYVTFVRDTVLQKIPYRSYRNIKERWILTKLALRIISNLLEFVPNLMVQLLCDSPLLRSCLTILTDCARIRDLSTGPIEHVDECSYECLTLINRVYGRQSFYLYRRDANAAKYDVVLVGIHELLMKVHSESGRAEYLLALLKFVDKLNPDAHRDIALQILSKIVSAQTDTDVQLYATVTADPNLSAIIRHTFCDCLENSNYSDDAKNDVLELLRSSVVHPSPNFGLFMLGVDKKIDFQKPGVNGFPKTVIHSLLDNLGTLSGAFQTLFVLIRDPRLQNPILRYLRTNQILVKFYIEHFPSLDMEVESVGYFLKCVCVDLKSVQQPGPLTHALVGQFSYKFLSVLEKIEMESDKMEIPPLDFFDKDQVNGAFKTCEYIDRELKVKLVDSKKLEDIFRDDISQLDKATVLRLRKSIQGEAKTIVSFAIRWNETRRREASKIFLFDCWRQCLEILVLSLSSLRLAGVDFVTSMIRLLTEKIVSSDTFSDAFQRLAAETTITLCAVLNVFTDELSETMLNLIINNLCTWVALESSSVVRALLYSSILYVMNLMRERKITASSHSSFSLIIDALCKDGQSAPDISRMQAMYLLGEIIRWNVSKGLGGIVPYVSMKTIEKQMEVAKSKQKEATFGSEVTSASMAQSLFDESKPDFSRNDSSLYASSPSHNKGNSSIFDIPGTRSFQALLNETDKQMIPGLVVQRSIEKTHSTQTALMTYLHNKGFLKNVVSSLSLSDDDYLVELFSKRPGSTHLRALLIYEAKMFMLTRLAKTGANAVQLLLSVNLLQRLADMKVFEGGYNLEEDNLARTLGYSYAMADDPLVDLSLPSKVDRLDNLYAGVLMLLHGMVSASPKNGIMIQGIWHFIIIHDEALSSLISYPPENGNIGQSLNLLTSLLALVGQKAPENSFGTKNAIFNKIVGVLRTHVRLSGMSFEQLRLARDAMLFLFEFAKREGGVKQKNLQPCQAILSPRIDYSSQTAATNTEIDLTVGLILKIVHDTSKLVYQTYDNEDKRTNYIVGILETGLTLAYWHVEMVLRDMFSKSTEFQKDQLIFQRDLQELIEGDFVKDVLEATEVLVNDMDYMKTMMMKLRRLAHLKKY